MVVVDTNVLVSAFLTPNGACASVFRWCALHHDEWLVTPALIAEYERVLLRPCFGFAQPTVKALIALLNECAVDDVEPVIVPMTGASREDLQFLSAANCYGARFLVTGNAKHFPTCHGPVRIVSPRAFVSAMSGPHRP